jgi:hypothetical protein
VALSKEDQDIQKARSRALLSDSRPLLERWSTVKRKWGGNDKTTSYGAAWDFVMVDYHPIYEAKFGPLSLEEANFLAQWIGKKLEDS